MIYILRLYWPFSPPAALALLRGLQAAPRMTAFHIPEKLIMARLRVSLNDHRPRARYQRLRLILFFFFLHDISISRAVINSNFLIILSRVSPLNALPPRGRNKWYLFNRCIRQFFCLHEIFFPWLSVSYFARGHVSLVNYSYLQIKHAKTMSTARSRVVTRSRR